MATHSPSPTVTILGKRAQELYQRIRPVILSKFLTPQPTTYRRGLKEDMH